MRAIGVPIRKHYKPCLLTERQDAIVKLLCDGKTQGQIAQEIGWSEGLVGTEIDYLHKLFGGCNTARITYLVGLHEGRNNHPSPTPEDE